MTYELAYWPAAADALDRLARDPATTQELRAVERTLRRLAEDPFNPRLGTTPFQSEALGGVSVTSARMDDWYVFWQRGMEPMVIEIILIHELRR